MVTNITINIVPIITNCSSSAFFAALSSAAFTCLLSRFTSYLTRLFCMEFFASSVISESVYIRLCLRSRSAGSVFPCLSFSSERRPYSVARCSFELMSCAALIPMEIYFSAESRRLIVRKFCASEMHGTSQCHVSCVIHLLC